MLGHVGWNVWVLWRSLGVQGSSQQPHISPTFPGHRPKDSVHKEFAALSPAGCLQNPDVFAHWCNLGQSFDSQGAMAPGNDHNTVPLGWQWGLKVSCVGCSEHTRVPWDAHDTCTFRRQFQSVSPRMLCSRDIDKLFFFIK